jgi:homoserine O-acetyltransferase
MDYFDLSGSKLIPKIGIDTSFLVISFQSDWLYPSYQSQEIVRLLKRRQVDATYCELKSTYGHDAFLVELEGQTTLIHHFLERTYSGKRNGNGNGNE